VTSMPEELIPGELTAVRECRARNMLCKQVRRLLAGSGLEIRELARELVIINPRDPHRGRIHVNYKTGEVSWSKTTWDYWGYLDGCGSAPDGSADGEAVIGASRIISALSGSADGSP
jgi:hypothetical protein